MAKPLRVWTGSEWVEVATQVFDTDLFLTTAVASATYLPISASFNPDGYLTEATASATYVAGDGITNIVALTQAEYDALTPDPNTLYVITD